jgi:four helix bundle protein
MEFIKTIYADNTEEELDISEPHIKYDEHRDFTTLKAWIICREVKLFFYKQIIPILAKDEKFNLDIQIRKAAISITANITEGYGRYHYREGIQFYRIARGSLYELKDHLITCSDLNYISDKIKAEVEKLIEDAKITLNGFINFVKNKIENKEKKGIKM